MPIIYPFIASDSQLTLIAISDYKQGSLYIAVVQLHRHLIKVYDNFFKIKQHFWLQNFSTQLPCGDTVWSLHTVFSVTAETGDYKMPSVSAETMFFFNLCLLLYYIIQPQFSNFQMDLTIIRGGQKNRGFGLYVCWHKSTMDN